MFKIPNSVWLRINNIIRCNAGQFSGDTFPYVTDEQGQWRRLPADQYAGWDGDRWSHGNWFCGFWVGLLLLAFEISHESYFIVEAQRWAEIMKFRQNDPNSHDIGYLFIPSFLKGYLLTRDLFWQTPAVTAAHVLAGRFDDRIGIIQAWGPLSDGRARGTSTIDTMMNLPLLWWAAMETGNVFFREIALTHARVSASTYLRQDGSTYHTARFDPASGELLERGTYQGLSKASCWSRGQAWAISGFSEAFRHTKDEYLLHAADRVSEYYFAQAPKDLVPYWDYADPEIPQAPRDSAAAAIAVGGFLTLAEVHPDAKKRDTYRKRARLVLQSLLERYLNRDSNQERQGILLHACYSKPHKDGIDSSLITGDFFFAQNLLRAARKQAAHTSPFSYSQQKMSMRHSKESFPRSYPYKP